MMQLQSEVDTRRSRLLCWRGRVQLRGEVHSPDPYGAIEEHQARRREEQEAGASRSIQVDEFEAEEGRA